MSQHKMSQTDYTNNLANESELQDDLSQSKLLWYKLAQFITPTRIRDIIRGFMVKWNISGKHCLEPWVGKGSLLPLFGKASIEAYDIDPDMIANICHQESLHLFNEDWLLSGIDIRGNMGMMTKAYDLIIANPPFANLRDIDPDKLPLYSKLYGNYLDCRTGNTYMLFIIKIVLSLLPGGHAILLLSSMFARKHDIPKIRKLVIDHCELLELQQVSTSGIILVLRRRHTILDSGPQMWSTCCSSRAGTHTKEEHNAFTTKALLEKVLAEKALQEKKAFQEKKALQEGAFVERASCWKVVFSGEQNEHKHQVSPSENISLLSQSR